MSVGIDRAKETIEHAHHHMTEGAEHEPDHFARNVAMLVAVLAAALAIAEIGEKSSQNAYLTFHITASDDWAFFQAKNIRANLYALHADALEALPTSTVPTIRRKIDDARAEAKRLDDDEASVGRKQLAEKAKESGR